jgi:transcriptional regulator with XRE-family HTH domain
LSLTKRQRGHRARLLREFSSVLQRARIARNLSQTQLARSARTTSVFISQVENAKRLPSDLVLKRIARALRLPWKELLRDLYRLKSSTTVDLFGDEALDDPIITSVAQLPGVRLLLLQLQGLRLEERHLNSLIDHWTSELRLFRGDSKRAISK